MTCWDVQSAGFLRHLEGPAGNLGTAALQKGRQLERAAWRLAPPVDMCGCWTWLLVEPALACCAAPLAVHRWGPLPSMMCFALQLL